MAKTAISLVGVVFMAMLALLYSNRYPIYEKLVLLKFDKFESTICLRYPDGNVRKLGRNKDSVDCLTTMILNKPDEFFERLILYTGTIGLGEAFVERIWDIPEKDFLGDLMSQIMYEANVQGTKIGEIILSWINPIAWKIWYQRVYLDAIHDRDFDAESIQFHYDLGNDFYSSFLGETMTYTCGIWDNNEMTLDDAQKNKLDILFNKLQIGPEYGENLKILDVGSGWGYLLSKMYNTTNAKNVTGITISNEQLAFSKEHWGATVSDSSDINKKSGLTGPQYLYSDYRDIEGPFDRIISVEMIEAVHINRLDEFMEHMYSILAPGGRLVIQHITNSDIYPKRMPINRNTACKYPSFIIKHIFPGGCILHTDWVHQAAVNVGFVQEHKEYYGAQYSRTLRNWYNNLKQNAYKLDSNKYDDRILRTFYFYFANSEAAFRNGIGDLVHQVFVKPTTNKFNSHDYSIGKFKNVIENVVNPNHK